MRVRVLLRTEWIKARGRMAARISVLTFAGLMLLIFGGSFLWAVQQGLEPAALPKAWSGILGDGIASFFAAIVLILLITSEFTWRTSRQNIIDGLSREEWFSAKLLILPIIAALFVLIQIGIGGTFGLIGSWMTAQSGPLMSSVDLAALGGFALANLGVASLAFVFAFLTRDSGPAIGLFFLYITIGELLLGVLIARIEALAGLVGYFPARVFLTLQSRATFDPSLQEPTTATAAGLGGAASAPPSPTFLSLLSLAYIIVFISAAFMIYRRRDL